MSCIKRILALVFLFPVMTFFLTGCASRVGDLKGFSSSATLAQFSTERLPPMQIPSTFSLTPPQTQWSVVYLENTSSDVYKALFNTPVPKPEKGFSAIERVVLSKVGVQTTQINEIQSILKKNNTPYTKVSQKEYNTIRNKPVVANANPKQNENTQKKSSSKKP